MTTFDWALLGLAAAFVLLVVLRRKPPTAKEIAKEVVVAQEEAATHAKATATKDCGRCHRTVPEWFAEAILGEEILLRLFRKQAVPGAWGRRRLRGCVDGSQERKGSYRPRSCARTRDAAERLRAAEGRHVRTRYFLDTEFIEDGKTIDLVSLALVCEDGREIYCCNTDAKLDLASEWVENNVFPSLPPFNSRLWMSHKEIAQRVVAFVAPAPKPEFWAYYADYDWVALCQLFGTMMQLPDHFPKYCMDLKQLSVMRGSPKHPEQEKGHHNALEDARWNERLFMFLCGDKP